MIRNIPLEAAEIMTASIGKSTISQYNSVLRLWFDFCEIENVNAYSPEISNVLSFLNQKYKEGASYSTLNSARNAISLISKIKIWRK